MNQATQQLAAGYRPEAQHKIFGAKAALTVETSTTRQGAPTIMLSMAPGQPRGPYRWEDKVCIQLIERELIAVAAVLVGAAESAKGEAHGEAHDKGFELATRQGRLVLRTWATGKHYAVALAAEDRFSIAAIALRQLRERAPWMNPADIVALLHATMPAESAEASQ